MGIYDRLGQVKSVGEYDAEAQQLASNKLALLTQQQNFADSNALRDAARSFGDDPEANYRTILGTGNVAAAQAYRKSNYDNQKTQADIAQSQSHAKNFDSEVASRAIADKIKAHDFHLQQLGSLTDPSQIDAWAAQGVKDGVLGMQESMQGAQAMKAYAAQNGFEAAKAQAMRGGMSAMQQLQQQLEQTKAQETGRHNVATEGNAVGQLAETARSHKVNEGIAGAHLGIARERLAQDNAVGGAEGFTPAAIENAAARYNLDGTLPPMGMGKTGSQGRQAILNRAAELSVGTSGTDQRIAQMDAKAAGGALNQLTKSKTMNASFEKTANANAELALGLSDKLPRTGMPLLNGAIQAVRSGTGSPEAAQFAAANQTFVAEYAKIMSGGMGNGPVSDAARGKAEKLLTTAMTADQYKGNVRLLQTEMANRMKGFDDEEKALRGRMGGKSDAPAAPSKVVQFSDLK